MRQKSKANSIWSYLAALALAGVCVFALAGGQRYLSNLEGRSRPFFSLKNLYFVMPAVPIDSVGLQQTLWTTDGRHLVLERSLTARLSTTLDDALKDLTGSPRTLDDMLGMRLESFDVATGKTRVLWQAQGVGIAEMVPYGQHKVLMAVERNLNTRQDRMPWLAGSAVLMDVETGQWRVLPHFQDLHGSVSIEPSPAGTTALVSYRPDPDWGKDIPLPTSDVPIADATTAVAQVAEAVPIAPTPVATAPREMTAESLGLVSNEGLSGLVDGEGNSLQEWPATIEASGIEWTADCRSFYWKRTNRRTKVVSYYAIDAKAKLVKLTDVPSTYTVTTRPPDLYVYEVSFSAADRMRYGSVSGLFLHANGRVHGRDLLIAAGGRSGELSPTGDSITFEVDHQVKVARLLKTTSDLLAQMKQVLKQRAMNDAKQAALGLMMYGNDSDDLLPPSGNWSDVQPYLKNSDIMDAFSYTPPSNLNMSQFSNPATTILGYVDGPDGRAVAYGDGHVRWIDDSDPNQ